MSIQKNIEAKTEALASLKAHCLCVKIVDDLVYVSPGYHIDAIRINHTEESYAKAENILEQIWEESKL